MTPDNATGIRTLIKFLEEHPVTPAEMIRKADQLALKAEAGLPLTKLQTTEMCGVRVQLAHYWANRAYEAATDVPDERTDLDKVREWASEYGWGMRRWVHPTSAGMWQLTKNGQEVWLAAFDTKRGTFEGAAHLNTAQGSWLINYLDDFLEQLED